jgi:hypothetical protein
MKLDIWVFSENMSRKFKFHANLTRIRGTLRGDLCTFVIFRWILLRMRNISGKGLEKITTCVFFYVQWLYPANGVVYEILCENVVWAEQTTHDNKIWRLRFACWITKARLQTHTENILYLMLLHGNYGYVNAPQCYVIRTSPPLFYYPVFVFQISKYEIKIMFTDKRKHRGSRQRTYITPVLLVAECSADTKFGNTLVPNSRTVNLMRYCFAWNLRLQGLHRPWMVVKLQPLIQVVQNWEACLNV